MNKEERRFQAAVAAMQADISEQNEVSGAISNEWDASKRAPLWVRCADALLSELDRTKPEPETPQPDAEGWIMHRPGDPAPLTHGRKVFVKFRDGTTSHNAYDASQWYWENDNCDSDILAWKPA